MRLLTALILLCVASVFGQDDAAKHGWKPGMTKAEYEAWKQQNIARMRAEQVSAGDLAFIENLKGGVHYFPFTGKKFVEVLSKFCEKIHGEYEVINSSPIMEMKPVTEISNGHGNKYNLTQNVIIGYIVMVRPVFNQRPENTPDK